MSLDVCPGCGGTWFDADELRLIVRAGDQDLEKVEEAGHHNSLVEEPGRCTLNCPDDGDCLEPYHYGYSSPVILNSCPQCGGMFMASQEIGKLRLWLHDEKDGGKKAEAVAVVVAATLAHEDELRKHQAISRFFGELRRRPPMWM